MADYMRLGPVGSDDDRVLMDECDFLLGVRKLTG